MAPIPATLTAGAEECLTATRPAARAAWSTKPQRVLLRPYAPTRLASIPSRVSALCGLNSPPPEPLRQPGSPLSLSVWGPRLVGFSCADRCAPSAMVGGASTQARPHAHASANLLRTTPPAGGRRTPPTPATRTGDGHLLRGPGPAVLAAVSRPAAAAVEGSTPPPRPAPAAAPLPSVGQFPPPCPPPPATTRDHGRDAPRPACTPCAYYQVRHPYGDLSAPATARVAQCHEAMKEAVSAPTASARARAPHYYVDHLLRWRPRDPMCAQPLPGGGHAHAWLSPEGSP